MNKTMLYTYAYSGSGVALRCEVEVLTDDYDGKTIVHVPERHTAKVRDDVRGIIPRFGLAVVPTRYLSEPGSPAHLLSLNFLD